MNFAEFPFRDCPKRVGRACSVALRSTETVVFDPFWPPYASQIHAQSIARTPFRTVSGETVWKIAEGISARLSGSKKHPNRDSFDPSWLLSEPHSGAIPNFQTVSEGEFWEVR